MLCLVYYDHQLAVFKRYKGLYFPVHGKSTPIASLGAVALKQTNVESVATVAMAIHCMASSKRLECVVVNSWDDFSRECSTYNTLGRALCVLI